MWCDTPYLPYLVGSHVPGSVARTSARAPGACGGVPRLLQTSFMTELYAIALGRRGRNALASVLTGKVFFPPEHAAAAIRGRARHFFRDKAIHRWAGGVTFEQTRLLVEAPQRAETLVAAQRRLVDRIFQDADGFVIDAQGHREGMAILAAESEGEARR